MPLVVVVATLLFGQVLDWARLPDIPDAEGFAGPFAGTSDDALIVAGGANFPQGRPWDGGRKVWHDRIFMLEEGAAAWRAAGRLPRPLAYGATVPHDGRVVCIGGSDEGSHHVEVFSLRRDGESVAITKLSPLPRPLAMHCAAVVGDRLFVAGGAESPQATEATRSFLSLDLADPAATWTAIEPWPGPGRILATAGVIEGRLYVLGGAGLALMARVGEEFPLECPNCGGDIRLIAFITEPGPIRKILTHLGEPLEPPPVSPARGPPTDWGELVQIHDDRDVF
ncbi:MAG: hypothetical protein ACKOEM_17805, partial [Planctomycetia bacterium]